MLQSLNVFGQNKSLILLMYFDRVQLYIWTKKSIELAGEYGKEPSEEAKSLLTEYSKLPVIIVTDFLEESFRHDSGVHVSGSDKNALLERKLNYSFRNTPYRAASVVGRETEGRKDDKILLSALTKPEMIEPWVRTFLEQKMQVQCVTSVAYLMQDYSQKAGLNDKHLMIVSIEEGSELRQTFLNNGKIQFSRLTSLTTKESASLADAINHESLQIRQYLERIKLLPFDSQMMIKVFSPFQIDEAAMEANNNELNVFQVFNIRELADSFALSIDGLEKSATTLFLARILQKTKLANVYAPLQVRKYFQLRKLANGLLTLGYSLVMFTVLLKFYSLLDTVDNWEQIENLQAQTAPLDRQYDLLTQSFPDTPIPSTEMALVVETTEKITLNSYLLQDALSSLSQALIVAPDLQLTEIIWEMAPREIAQEDQQFGSFGSFSPIQQNSDQEIQNYTLQNQTQVNIIVQGFASSPQSYQEAHNQVQNFINTLNEIPGITITSSKMPTEVRVDTTVSTLVDNNALRAPFTVEMKLEPMQ
jgi:hypothetical protein